jgi:hypothetical protein
MDAVRSQARRHRRPCSWSHSFEALTVIKYNELLNDRVLALCSERLGYNSTLQEIESLRNKAKREKQRCRHVGLSMAIRRNEAARATPAQNL